MVLKGDYGLIDTASVTWEAEVHCGTVHLEELERLRSTANKSQLYLKVNDLVSL